MPRRYVVTDLHVTPPAQDISPRETLITTFDVNEDGLSATIRLINYTTNALTTGQPSVSFSTGTDVATVTTVAPTCELQPGEIYELQLVVTYPDGELREYRKILLCV